MRQFNATQLNEYLHQAGSDVLLLDVREPWEYEHCHLEGSLHIPMGQIPNRHQELNQNQEIVVVCHHGMRSLQVAQYLEKIGFKNVSNLNGGIDAWAREVDPEMPVY